MGSKGRNRIGAGCFLLWRTIPIVESSVGIPMDIDINYLTHDELKQFIQDYATAAKHAMMAGVDIINVHGAHGQLPALLFNPVFNKVTDEYSAQNFEKQMSFCGRTFGSNSGGSK